jgi:hypothetical protein
MLCSWNRPHYGGTQVRVQAQAHVVCTFMYLCILGFATKISLAFLISSISDTPPTHLIDLPMIIQIIFREDYTVHLFNCLFNAEFKFVKGPDKISTPLVPLKSFLIDQIYF